MKPTDAADRRPQIDDESCLPRYTVRTVARRVGVPTATLRSWNQRYGVGPVRHSPGRHRLYSESDIAVVQHMHSLIDQGASARSAAQSALETAMPELADTTAVLEAALGLDAATVGRMLDRHLRQHGVIETWDRVVRPVFAAIETQQGEGERCIDVEHVLSWTVARCLQRLPIVASDAPASVILACTEAETHTLALEALRAALCERSRAAVMMGATTPLGAMIDALARRPMPTTLVLFSQTECTAELETVHAVNAVGAQLMLAGPGWDSVAIPAAAVRVNSLDEALQRLTTAT